MRFTCGESVETNETELIYVFLDDGTECSGPISPASQLQTIIKHYKRFEDSIECQTFIQSTALSQRIILIAGAAAVKELSLDTHGMVQLLRIFAYYDGGEIDHQLTAKYTKARLVKLEKLAMSIKLCHQRWLRCSPRSFISMEIFNDPDFQSERSSTGLNGVYLWMQLMLDLLLEIPPSEHERENFFDAFSKWLKNKPAELKKLQKFNIDYSKETVVKWYTEDSFLYRILNKAFRSQNMDVLLLLRFYICDLHEALKIRCCSEPVRVYRAQLINSTELDSLRDSEGKYISMNSFLSTSGSLDAASLFLDTSPGCNEQCTGGFQHVFFEIEADPRSNVKTNVFAHISDEIVSEENEFLFLFGAVFRVNAVFKHPEMPTVTVISMTLCHANDRELDATRAAMKREYLKGDARSIDEEEKPSLISLVNVLIGMGHLTAAENLAYRILKSLKDKPDSDEFVRCYLCIGDVHRQRDGFRKSRSWYKKALKMLHRLFPSGDSPLIATVHMNLGHAHSKMTDWRFASWYRTDIANWWGTKVSRRWRRSRASYERALNLYKRVCGEDNTRLGAFYFSAGFVPFKCQQYTEAKTYYEQGLAISEKTLPSLHPDLAYYHMKIGLTYRAMNQSDQAVEHYQKALNIGLRALPTGHPLIVELYYNLGTAYKENGDSKQAREYFEKQIYVLNNHRTIAPSAKEIIQTFYDKIYYLCPRCELPVWVYSACPMFRGSTCRRCLGDIVQCQVSIRVAPQ